MLYVTGYLRKSLYRSHCKTKRYPICYELDCPYRAAHTVRVMEKFQFRFVCVPFSVLQFTVLVTVQLPCGMRVVYITRLFISIFHGHLVFPEVLTWKLQVQIFRTCANQPGAYTAFLSADKFATPQRSSYTCRTMEELASRLCPAKIACSAT